MSRFPYPERGRTALLWRPRARRRLAGGAPATLEEAATVTQEGFRWRNDDGSETTATWLAAQDTNASLDIGETARLRMILDATGDPDPFPPTLYYRKVGGVGGTIGNTTQMGSSAGANSDFNCEALVGPSYRYTASSGDVVTEVAVYGDGTGDCQVGVYEYSGGVPTTRVGTINVAIEESAGWHTGSGSIALADGVTYVVAIDYYLTAGWNIRYGTTSAGDTSISTVGAPTPSLQATWTQASTAGTATSFYATVTNNSPWLPVPVGAGGGGVGGIIGWDQEAATSAATGDNWQIQCFVSNDLTHVASEGDVVTEFVVYGDGTGLAEMALYEISGGVPTNRVGTATTVNIGAGAGWHVTTVDIPLTAGIRYGVAMDYEAGLGWNIRYGSGPGGTTMSSGVAFGPLPSTWSQTGTGTDVVSFYATVTAASTDPVYIAASSNITAGGQDTTAQLTAPSGKTTADFSVGRMWDDENGIDEIDIGVAAFLPTDITWAEAFWADDPGFTPPADGANISAATGLMGGTWSINAGTPHWVANMAGTGKPAVQFSGAERLMHTLASGLSNRTWVIVGRALGTSDADLVDGEIPSSGGDGRVLFDSNGGDFRVYAGNSVAVTNSDTGLHLFFVEFRPAANESLWIDGTLISSFDGGTQTGTTALVIGCGPSGGANSDGSQVAFAGMYSGLLTQDQRDDLLAWYQSHYGRLTVTTDLIVHLDASTLTLANNDPVSSWTDVSPVGTNHATPVADTNRPLYIASGLNGLPTVRFDGTDNYLTMPSGFSTWTAGFTWFFVATPGATPTNNEKFLSFSSGGSRVIACGRNASTSEGILFSYNSSDAVRYFYSSTGLSPASTGAVYSFHNPAGTADAAVSGEMRKGNVSFGTGDTYIPPVVTRSDNFIGVSWFGPEFYKGDFSEILVYNRALTEPEITAVYAYLNEKYGL